MTVEVSVLLSKYIARSSLLFIILSWFAPLFQGKQEKQAIRTFESEAYNATARTAYSPRRGLEHISLIPRSRLHGRLSCVWPTIYRLRRSFASLELCSCMTADYASGLCTPVHACGRLRARVG
jgi:hypothetical protein